jgi:uncharacterized damage-inducible protein DinB
LLVTELTEARFLLAYSRWANAQILTACEGLGTEPFTRDLRSSYRSIRDTLVHVAWAEWLWLERVHGRSPLEVFDPTDFPTVASVRARWRPVEAGFAAQVADRGADVARPVTYTNARGEQWTYRVGQIIRHVVNHATYHRGQVVTLLRQVGTTPPVTDLLIFVDVGAPGTASPDEGANPRSTREAATE